MKITKILSVKAAALLLLSTSFIPTFSQNKSKPQIDSFAVNNWEHCRPAQISPDGKFAAYMVDHQENNGQTAIFQSTDGKWIRKFKGCDFGRRSRFILNSSFGMLWKGNDSLILVKLGTDITKTIAGVALGDQPDQYDKDWIVKKSKETLRFENLKNNKKHHFENVKDFVFSRTGNQVLIVKKIQTDKQSILLIDLSKGTIKEIWQGDGLAEKSFSSTGNVLLYVNDGQKKGSIWFYNSKDPAKKIISSEGFEKTGLELTSKDLRFSDNGRQILFTTKAITAVKSVKKDNAKKGSKVTVWNYADKTYMPAQINPDAFTRPTNQDATFNQVYNLSNAKIFSLRAGEEFAQSYHDRFLVSQKFDSERLTDSIYSVNAPIGKRTNFTVIDEAKLIGGGKESPDGRFKLYYDLAKTQWWMIDLLTGREKYLSDNYHVSFGEVNLEDNWVIGSGPVGFFSSDSKYVFLGDIYGDIWKVSLLNSVPPINVTANVGYKENIFFKPVFSSNVVTKNQVILKGINWVTKMAGYYILDLSKSSKPILLSQTDKFFDDDIQKAKNAEAFVIRRMSASVSPNIYFSKDLKSFEALSDVKPEQKYNWLTSQLLTFKGFDGKPANAVLYKPENFDPNKKYPIILTYYTRMSDALNIYERPGMSYAAINIPWFVSRGYLICTVDIHYEQGETGFSALKSVNLAADQLVKLPFVDTTNIGLQGHSFGGYETNFIVIHSTRFAAAQAGAGPSELIGLYLDVQNKTAPNNILFETGQMRMGKSIWEIPDNYLRNSPVMSADKVTTPLLLLHNSGDYRVPFAQGRNMFNALRRLGKPVWLLDYDGDGHTIFHEENAIDFTRRLEQFFGHYLKGEPSPLWMTKGVPYSDRANTEEYFKLNTQK